MERHEILEAMTELKLYGMRASFDEIAGKGLTRRDEILEAMTELKLYGMRASFDEIAGKGLTRRDEIFPLLASLIRAERTHRQARSISYRMSGAKFPVLKDIGKFA